jgi:Zn-dependent M28 family amino/carboxypeptidase
LPAFRGDLIAARGMLRGFLGVLLLIGAAGTLWMLQPLLLPIRRRPAIHRADPDRLARDVETLISSHSPRDFTRPERLLGAAEYLAAEMRATGAVVGLQEIRAEGAKYYNVIAVLGPDSNDRVVVGAHYDTDGPFPGADDNASGVAGLLELARLLAADPPLLRVELVAYCLEEMPFFATEAMGSAVHARSLRRSEARVRAMLCLEMIGFFADRPGSQSFPFGALKLFYPSRGNFIAVVGRPRDGLLVRRVKTSIRSAGGVPVRSINAPTGVPGVGLSDHASYWAAGYPAVMITDTAFYRNPNYHAETDRPETLDYRRMAAVVDGVATAVRNLAGSPARLAPAAH